MWRKLGLRVRFLSKYAVIVVIVVIMLSSIVLPALVHTPLLAQSSSIDFSQEYSSGDVQVFPSLDAWYAWISINGTHTIFLDRKSTRLNSSHSQISYAVFCLKNTQT